MCLYCSYMFILHIIIIWVININSRVYIHSIIEIYEYNVGKTLNVLSNFACTVCTMIWRKKKKKNKRDIILLHTETWIRGMCMYVRRGWFLIPMFIGWEPICYLILSTIATTRKYLLNLIISLLVTFSISCALLLK